MLREKDKYEMLVGRKELAARYHKYLNKMIKERRTLYVMINIDGSGTPSQAEAKRERGGGGDDEDNEDDVAAVASLSEGVAQRVRLKIKSGQSAAFLAKQLVEKYALEGRHLATIQRTLEAAIAAHEEENGVYEAEAAKVGMLLAPGEGDRESDDEDAKMRGDDSGPAVTDPYLLMKKRLVKARRLAKEFGSKREAIARDLDAHVAMPKVRVSSELGYNAFMNHLLPCC